MNTYLFSYALEGIKRKKKLSISVLLVMTVTFSFLIFSISILGSIKKTNDEFRIKTYGEWYADVIDVSTDADSFKSVAGVISCGEMKSIGYIVAGEKAVSVGIVDEPLKNIGNLELVSGCWPESSYDVVMEADTLCELGLDYTLGQEIRLPVIIETENGIYEIEKQYKLSGIVKEFTDIWSVQYQDFNIGLTGIILSDDAFQLLSSEAAIEFGLKENEIIKRQVFINVEKELRDQAVEQIISSGLMGDDSYLSINNCIISESNSDSDSTRYIFYILVVTAVSILFIDILQFERLAHNYSIMRSTGMTKKQLLVLNIYETLIMCVPAILLGAIIGIFIIYFSMKMIMYGGSVPVQMSIPIVKMAGAILLWIGTVIVGRLIVFALTMRVPLVGKISLKRGKRKIILIARKLGMYVLCTMLCGIVIFTCIRLVLPIHHKNDMKEYPSYVLWNSDVSDEDEEMSYTVDDNVLQTMKEIPGISKIYGFNEYQLNLKEDEDEIVPNLYAVNWRDWKSVLDIENTVNDLASFENGDTVMLCIPEEQKEKYNPGTEIDLTVYDKGRLLFEDTDVKIAGIRYIPFDLNTRLLAGFNDTYAVVCSKKFLEKYGITGSSRIYIHPLYTVANTSLDTTLATYSKQNGLTLSNRREEYQAYYQEAIQEIIMTITMGLTISLIIILLYLSVLSYEAKYMERNYKILRSIGMSKKQWNQKLVIMALCRMVISYILGWLIYIGAVIVKNESLVTVYGFIKGNYLLACSSVAICMIIFVGTVYISNKKIGHL